MTERKRTQRKPVIVDGVTFESFHTGFERYELISKDGRCVVGRNSRRTTYFASVDRVSIGHRFMTESTALRAAVNKIKTVKRVGKITKMDQAAKLAEQQSKARSIFKTMRHLINGPNHIDLVLTRQDMETLLSYAPSEDDRDDT